MTATVEVTRTNQPAGKAWLQALQLTANISRNPERTLPSIIQELATKWLDTPALVSARECLTYQQLAERSNRYARWALDQGIAKGDVVGLLMTNRPEYIAVWLGLTQVGVVVALLNTSLVGPSLAHCVREVSPTHLIVAAELAARITETLPSLAVTPSVWIHGREDDRWPRIDRALERLSGRLLGDDERRQPAIEDRALYIYTSGTTGLPKAALVSHARILQWSYWFAGMMGTGHEDRMYSCLPMYHSVGGVQVPGALLVAGGTVVTRERFSASQFWKDVIRWDCTLVQYIGELCRYLLHATPSSLDTAHRVRMACGNGLAADVWEPFQKRFAIPNIFEFYASTEGGVSLFNISGERGAIGHIPSYLSHRFAPALVAFDTEKGEPVRNAEGFCVRCGPGETGEALGQAVDDAANIGSRFEGYHNEQASEKKVLRDVFRAGDVWIRTGDLMRKDKRGYFYFVDRIGDTFRWKGENVSASEVENALCAFPGITHANVYGITIPGAEGRAGMAALVAEEPFDLLAFREFLKSRLPAYAHPLFLRMRGQADLTGTFKYSKAELVGQGFDPAANHDKLYFNNLQLGGFAPLGREEYDAIQQGKVRF